MEERIIFIGYGIDLLYLSLLAKKNIHDTSNESIACKCIFTGLEIVRDFFRNMYTIIGSKIGRPSLQDTK